MCLGSGIDQKANGRCGEEEPAARSGRLQKRETGQLLMMKKQKVTSPKSYVRKLLDSGSCEDPPATPIISCTRWNLDVMNIG